MHSKEYYLRLRNKYTPDNIRVIFLLESPPRDESYFYDPNKGNKKDLYSAMMKYLDCKLKNKADGLRKFCDKGYLVIDSIYEPVNNLPRGINRNRQITTKIIDLINDIISKQKVGLKIIIIMPHLHQMFYGLFKAIGLNVINDKPIPFPAYQWKKIFLEELLKLKIRFNLP